MPPGPKRPRRLDVFLLVVCSFLRGLVKGLLQTDIRLNLSTGSLKAEEPSDAESRVDDNLVERKGVSGEAAEAEAKLTISVRSYLTSPVQSKT